MSASGQRRHDRNRRAILDTALELIEQSGLDGWSMRELAERVDYTVGALYRYVDGKAALLDALGAEAMDGLRARMERVAPAGPPLDRLRELGLAYLAFAEEQPTLFRIAMGELPSRRRSVEAEPGEGSPYTVLLDAVRAAIETGALATGALDAEAIAYTVWATVHGMATLERTHLRGFDADFASLHGAALDRLLAGPAAA